MKNVVWELNKKLLINFSIHNQLKHFLAFLRRRFVNKQL